MDINFDASQVAPSQPFMPLEPGWYTVKIIEQEPKPTKDNATSGSWYLKLVLEVMGGEHNGRKLFHNLNLKNANPEAMRIAYEQLSAICHAVGRIKIGKTEELNGLPMTAKVSIRTDPTGQYEPQNEIKGFKAVEGGASGGVQNPGGASIAQPSFTAPAAAVAAAAAPAAAAAGPTFNPNAGAAAAAPAAAEPALGKAPWEV